jgi:hypothetical protein
MTNRITNYVGVGAIALATTLGGCASTRPSQLERDVQYNQNSQTEKTKESSNVEKYVYTPLSFAFFTAVNFGSLALLAL